ncbi:dCTP deaminase [Asticcacaulis benevestitus]|uniref:dCTP deaminase n=1 Tax=Asticcacaulis benevestitus DSM 16100 = ATCC BAA-896 TaxID=1121022 RepID=V4PW06_9CAUL|nr:hypothetical protein [Asticcacaulis benevestitus]ESQ89765.1 hypothetical protein ABENE_13565 [Asticcacaulis benevestitus DSM 16100 = ATCC BAA-896]
MIQSKQNLIEAIGSGNIYVEPLDPELISNSSIGLRLAEDYYLVDPVERMAVDRQEQYPEIIRQPLVDGKMLVKKDQVILSYTMESISVSNGFCAFLAGTSDLARLGVSVAISHFVGAGFGRDGPQQLILEIETRAVKEILLVPGMRIAHLVVCAVDNAHDEGKDPAGHWKGSGPHSTLAGRLFNI